MTQIYFCFSFFCCIPHLQLVRAQLFSTAGYLTREVLHFYPILCREGNIRPVFSCLLFSFLPGGDQHLTHFCTLSIIFGTQQIIKIYLLTALVHKEGKEDEKKYLELKLEFYIIHIVLKIEQNQHSKLGKIQHISHPGHE